MKKQLTTNQLNDSINRIEFRIYNEKNAKKTVFPVEFCSCGLCVHRPSNIVNPFSKGIDSRRRN